MLDFILQTLEQNPQFDKIIFDGDLKIDKNFEIIDKEKAIIKFQKIFINLKSVKTVQFEHVLTQEEQAEMLKRQAEILAKVNRS